MWRMFGPPRSRLGRWMEQHDISQVELSKLSGVPRGTIGNLARDCTMKPTRLTARKLLRAMREFDTEITAEDFWG